MQGLILGGSISERKCLTLSKGTLKSYPVSSVEKKYCVHQSRVQKLEADDQQKWVKRTQLTLGCHFGGIDVPHMYSHARW